MELHRYDIIEAELDYGKGFFSKFCQIWEVDEFGKGKYSLVVQRWRRMLDTTIN